MYRYDAIINSGVQVVNFFMKVLKKRHYALMRLKMAPKPISGGVRMLTQEKKIHLFWDIIATVSEFQLQEENQLQFC